MPARPLPENFHVAFSFAEEQRNLVRSIAEAVESELGFGTTFLDEWFEHYLAGHDGQLKLQSIYSGGCALAVVCISEQYGDKPWTLAEHEAIQARVMKSRASSDERDRHGVLPIRVGDGEVEGIFYNTIVPDVRARKALETAKLILDRLRLIIPDLKTASDVLSRRPAWPDAPAWPDTAPSLTWPMADHSSAREALGLLLTSQTPWRFLPIRGDSETGKSHITLQMLANALAIPGIACGRFDFKGTTNMDSEVRSFIQDLGVSAPRLGTSLHEPLGHILEALRQRAQPTLLIFDTYEEAGKTQDWVEKQLLQCLIRADWLRVVIAGQKVPDPTGPVWAAKSRTILELKPPPPPDWFDYGRQYRPSLTLADVETACKLAKHKAGLLSQLLGPRT